MLHITDSGLPRLFDGSHILRPSLPSPWNVYCVSLFSVLSYVRGFHVYTFSFHCFPAQLFQQLTRRCSATGIQSFFSVCLFRYSRKLLWFYRTARHRNKAPEGLHSPVKANKSRQLFYSGKLNNY